MFKYVVLLCCLIAATLYTVGGRTDAPLRDGLAGKLPPLVYRPIEQSAAQPADMTAAVQPPASVAPDTATAPARAAPVLRPQPDPSRSRVVSAAFATADAEAEAVSDPQAAQSLTLALPLVDPETTAISPAVPDAGQSSGIIATPTLQYVVADTVNVRIGPSAKTTSLTKLDRGEAVLVLPSDTPGWSMIRIEGDGVEGYIATRFLGDAPQDGIFTPVN